MSERGYFLKFTYLSNCALAMVSDFRAYKSMFIMGVFEDLFKECRTLILVKEMDISKLMVNVQ